MFLFRCIGFYFQKILSWKIRNLSWTLPLVILGVVTSIYFIYGLEVVIKNKEILTGIFIAYVGYIRYSMDKELEIVKRYVDKYSKISEDSKMKRIIGMIHLWYEEFYMYKRGYISGALWAEWNSSIEYDLKKFSLNKKDWENIKELMSERKYERFTIGKEFRNFLVKKIEKIKT